MAEVLGFEHDEALTLGRAVAGLNAYSKGVSLGLFQPTPREVKEQRQRMRKEETVTIDLLHRAVPAKHTDEGLRALSDGRLIQPGSAQKYLESKFGDALEDVSNAIEGIHTSFLKPPCRHVGTNKHENLFSGESVFNQFPVSIQHFKLE